MKRELTKQQEIERSIIKTYRSKLWAPFISALKDYELLKEGDSVCVCISGGKDSMLMAKLFQELKKHSDFQFDVKYLVMNPGYNEINLQKILNNLSILGIDAKIENTDIFEIANSCDKSPCYLCARMRRGALYKLAKNMGCNKIALGHHYDDVIETFMMSILQNGSVQTMLPKLHSQNYGGMEVIRPMYLIRERDIIQWKNFNGLEFIQCACRFTENCAICDNGGGGSKRLETKYLIHNLEKDNPIIVKNIFKAQSNIKLDMLLGYKKDGIYHNFLDTYDDTVLEED